MDSETTRNNGRNKRRQSARLRLAPSGAEVQPWYGITEIDDELATAVHFQRRDVGGTLLYDLRFAARETTVVQMVNLDAAQVRAAVGDVNAWAIATAESATGVLADSSLAGAYGLSPLEAHRRAAACAGAAGLAPRHERSHHPTPTSGHQLDQAHELATVRRVVEEATYPLLVESIQNPVTRQRVVIGICQRLHTRATAGPPPGPMLRPSKGQPVRPRDGPTEHSGAQPPTARIRSKRGLP